MSVWDREAVLWERPGESRGVRFLKIMAKAVLFGGVFGLVCGIVLIFSR